MGTYNRLIHAAGLQPAGGLAAAMNLFAEIKARTDVSPDEYTFGSLLAACARHGSGAAASPQVHP